jgi:SAM-dependent methyltransferase
MMSSRGAAQARRGDLVAHVRNGIASSLALLAMTLTCTTHAQSPDVPFVATPPVVVEAMLEIARVGPTDYLVDLGSGDGRIVIAAAKKYGARAMGVDLDAGLVYNARREAERQGVKEKVEFRAQNLFTADIANATVVTSYLLPNVNVQLRPRLFAELRPGTRVVSHEFDFGNWKPDAHVIVPVPGKRYGEPTSTVYLWVIPANGAGRWQWKGAVNGEVTLEQKFQELRGSGRIGAEAARVETGRIRGDTIELVLASRDTKLEVSGRLSGEKIVGTARTGGAAVETQWDAVRTARGRINIE